jgi:hypothetical protein
MQAWTEWKSDALASFVTELSMFSVDCEPNVCRFRVGRERQFQGGLVGGHKARLNFIAVRQKCFTLGE